LNLVPSGIFVNKNNNVYAATFTKNEVLIWLNESVKPTHILSDGLIYPSTVFARMNGDVYVGSGNGNYSVDKWTLDPQKSVPIMNVKSYCSGIFIDINDNIYCSLLSYHQVVMKSLNDSKSELVLVAGNGSSGSLSHMLKQPRGIFVDLELNLYIADSQNGRIQKFSKGEKNGTAVAGKGGPISLSLNNPTGVIVDENGYLYISDGSHRIIRAGPTNSTCLIGCSGSGSSPNQLFQPISLSFDNNGNIFVSDSGNGRIQKFALLPTSCGKNKHSF
jgi:sugar lactone lactonase YvrE